MFGVYVTHPQVAIDPAVPVPQWGLSQLGADRARIAARQPWVARFGRIVSSGEVKAIETARILAEPRGIDVEIVEGMHENDRSATGFLPPDQFEAAADWFFANPDQSFKGWERASDAQARIVDHVERLLRDHDKRQPIAFVGHGGVGTLLKCHLSGRPIGRDRDQPSGGGNLFAFSLEAMRLSCDWTPIELAKEIAP